MASGVWEAILAPEAAAQACGGDEEGVVLVYYRIPYARDFSSFALVRALNAQCN